MSQWAGAGCGWGSARSRAPGFWLATLLGLAALATLSPAFHAWCLLDREAVAAGELWRLWTGHLAHFSMSHLLVDGVVFALLGVALVRSGGRVAGREACADTVPSESDVHPAPSPPWNGGEGRGEEVRDIVASPKLPSLRSCLAEPGGAVAVGSWGAWSLGWALFVGAVLLSLSLLASDASLARYGGLSGLNSLLLGWLAVRWFRAGGPQRALGLGLLAVAVGKFALDLAGLAGPAMAFDGLAVVSSQLSHWLGLGWGMAAGWTQSAGIFRPRMNTDG